MAVDNTYVNSRCIHISPGAVENSCGKVCGECGKVRVFNRYSASLGPCPPLWKTLHTPLHKGRAQGALLMLRYRRKEVLSSRKSSKLLKAAVILTVEKPLRSASQKYFCEI